MVSDSDKSEELDGRILADVLAEVASLSREDYVATYPAPVLLVEKEDGDTESPLAAFATLRLADPGEQSAAGLRLEDLIEDLRAAGRSAQVLWVTKQTEKYASIVTIGRAPKSDVRINLASVSKFHCYFTHNPRNGTWHLSDANSANGTYLNGRKLEANIKHRLEDGSAIRMGLHLRARFFSPEGFYDYLTALSRSLR